MLFRSPPDQISKMMQYLLTLNYEGISCLGYGHLGDGNIHVNILNLSLSDDDWDDQYPKLTKQIFEKAVSLGGTLTGEHGIGFTKKDYMSLIYSLEDLTRMKAIKVAFDPKGILNPGKIFM